jgi:arylsulfatase A-like enzyme
LKKHLGRTTVFRASRSVTHLSLQLVLACSLLLLGFALPEFCCSVARAQSPQPNVVMFLADDMGWTDWQRDAVLNPTGSVVYETPNLLRLAQQSVNFQNAYAAAPICSPTRVSILTGKSPARTKLTNFLPGNPNVTANLREPSGWASAMSSAEVTLAESFKGGGYSTAYFGKWHLGPSGQASSNPASPQNGFDLNVGGTHFSSPPLPDGYFAGADGMWAGMPGLNTLGQFPSDKYLGDALADQAVDYISQQVIADQPFFMSFWDYSPHIPIQAPASLVAKYQSKISTLQGMGVDLMGHTNPTYAAMIEKMDESIGRLLD